MKLMNPNKIEFDIDNIDIASIHYNDEYHKVCSIVRDETVAQLQPGCEFVVKWGGDYIKDKSRSLCPNCGYYVGNNNHQCNTIALDRKTFINLLIHQFRIKDGCQLNINGNLVKEKIAI